MKFRIDLKIFLFIILFILTRQIEIYSLVMIFALVHELGHLIVGLICGMKPNKLSIMSFGISISFKIMPEEYNKKIKNGNIIEIKKIIVALAGPITNLLVILVVNNMNINIIKGIMIIYTNLLIMIFNLLPIYPLDGGRILKGILHINYGKKRAEKYINQVSFITVIIITAVSSILILYIQNIAIFLIDVYLWYLVIKENIIYKRRMEIYTKILENKIV